MVRAKLTKEQSALGDKWSHWLRARPSFPRHRIPDVIATLRLVAHVYDTEAGGVGPAAFAHFAFHRAGALAVAGLPLDDPARVATRKAEAVAALLDGHAGLTEVDAALVVEAVWAGIPKPAAATASNAPPAPPAAPLPPAAAEAATPVAHPVEAAGNPATTQCGWCCGTCKLSLESRSWVQELFVSAGNETETLTCGDCYAARPGPQPQLVDKALAWTAHMGPADARGASPLVALALAPAMYATDAHTEKAEAARRVLEAESANYMNFAKEFGGSADLNGKRYLLRFLRRRPPSGLRFAEWTPQWIRDARKAKRMGECPSRGRALLRGVWVCA